MRGPLWEAVTATNYLQAGADILVMRHPKSIAMLRESLDELSAAGATGELRIQVVGALQSTLFQFKVKVIEVDELKRVNLSKKQAE